MPLSTTPSQHHAQALGALLAGTLTWQLPPPHTVLDKGEVHDQAATFLYDPMIGRELIILDSAACVLAARGRAAAPRPPSALDAAKLCSMLGRSALPHCKVG